MSSVYLPAQVVLLFRRIVNVISTISLSTQYLRTSASSSSAPAEDPERDDTIHRLIANPVLYDPLRRPRYPIVLCHGLYGFDSRGPQSFPSLRMHYWANVLSILRDKLGVEVIVTAVPPTGSVSSRAEALHAQLSHRAMGRGVNFMAHSMGGLDCRHLISNVRPTEYAPLSLTTISTPHRGSPFMDWCAQNLGLGKKGEDGTNSPVPEPSSGSNLSSESKLTLSTLSSLPSSFTTLLLSILDSPAYSNLTTNYLQQAFNPSTPDNPDVKYFSVTSRVKSVSIWHPFWFPKMVVDEWEKEERERLRKQWEADPRGQRKDSSPPLFSLDSEWGNDGLVPIQSAKWGEFLGVLEGCDHWELRGSRGIEFGVDLPGIPSIPSIPSISIPSLNLGSLTSFDDRSKMSSRDKPEARSDRERVGTRSGGGLGIGFGSSFGEWSFGTSFAENKDLGSFLKAWWTQEREAKAQAQAEADQMANSNAPLDSGSLSPKGMKTNSTNKSTSDSTFPKTAETKSASQARRELERERDDEVIKASTEKLSRVFDWFSSESSTSSSSNSPSSSSMEKASNISSGERRDPSSIPLLHRSSSSTSSSSSSPSSSFPGELKNNPIEEEIRSRAKDEASQKPHERHELATKMDLERFYVALTRKLWDEGL
ncbi:alpha/beta-hydrolase [Dendrothele bispora CBS 962.96]|uniref:Alpha/beta-hydrolase n=1 Tax=Dendrothele bispora (strain CBS 962.96) TaxID=1314807 RepID=A0A4S8MQE7_DENBC|nr:alpha/beta-hydrolase [Dendrothele bispora CBS 962.96]